MRTTNLKSTIFPGRRLSWIAALAFTLLAASAVLLAQLGILLRVHPGFDPNHLLTFRLSAPGARYRDLAQLVPYQLRLTQALQSIPGVDGADVVYHCAAKVGEWGPWSDYQTQVIDATRNLLDTVGYADSV